MELTKKTIIENEMFSIEKEGELYTLSCELYDVGRDDVSSIIEALQEIIK